MWLENETTEFKLQVNDSTIKSVIAFANTNGGVLYLGVDDKGAIIGLDDIDSEMTKLTSKLKNCIKPDVLMMVSCVPETHETKNILVVTVSRGAKRPYYLAAKGMRPEGVYVRSGSASIPSSDTSIVQMIRESNDDNFEERRSLQQELTFSFMETEFKKKNRAFTDSEKRTLGIINAEGLFSNLALLLSDQCTPTLKAATFKGSDRNIFTERTEFSGSLLKQMQDAYNFLRKNNYYETEFRGLEREDYYDYPEVALREALVNAVVHRDYALSGSTLLSVLDNGIEIVSLGGLPTGIVFEDLKANISVPRNRLLANIFFRLEVIEAYGTGIRRMRSSYEGSHKEPSIAETPNTFTVFLPNRNLIQSKTLELSTEETLVFKALQQGLSARSEIQEYAQTSQATTLRILKRLAGRGLVVSEGGSRNTRYRLQKGNSQR